MFGTYKHRSWVNYLKIYVVSGVEHKQPQAVL